MLKSQSHVPVMLEESIKYLNIKPNGIYVDCTLGRAGHSKKILEKLTTGKLIAFDQDETAIKASNEILKASNKNFFLVKNNFVYLLEELNKLNINKVDGILYDLGISSPQVDEPERGFSYKNNARLDMRMDQSQELTAWDIVNHYSFNELKKIIRVYGEETFAGQIAKNIVIFRQKVTIDTTEQLASIIKNSLPMKVLNKHHHPAKKTFQALRIAVNDELTNLQESLDQALKLLNKNGRIVVISFHSLEDRIVKKTFNNQLVDPQKLVYDKLPVASKWKSDYCLVAKKSILPTVNEIEENPRSRSAKMRVIERIN